MTVQDSAIKLILVIKLKLNSIENIVAVSDTIPTLKLEFFIIECRKPTGL